MLLKFFIDYPYVVYSILVWGFILAVIRLKGIKRLWPAAVCGGLIIFASVYWLVSSGLYKINITFLPILGIPFFLVLWGAGSGIVFANYLGGKAWHRVFSILVFSGITVGLEWFVEYYKRIEHMGNFDNLKEYVFDIFILTTLSFILTNFFRNRLKKEEGK